MWTKCDKGTGLRKCPLQTWDVSLRAEAAGLELAFKYFCKERGERGVLEAKVGNVGNCGSLMMGKRECTVVVTPLLCIFN